MLALKEQVPLGKSVSYGRALKQRLTVRQVAGEGFDKYKAHKEAFQNFLASCPPLGSVQLGLAVVARPGLVLPGEGSTERGIMCSGTGIPTCLTVHRSLWALTPNQEDSLDYKFELCRIFGLTISKK